MKKIAFAGVAIAALIAIPAAAQSGADRPARNAGPLTRASVEQAVEARFAKADANRDGFVTREEARARVEEARERRAERMGERRERMAERRAERRAGLFDRIDADKNGSISRAEFDAHASARAERRGDRARPHRAMRHARMMRRHHMRGMAAARFGAAMFERMDSNKDGRVSLAEAKAPALAMFERADSNRDGTVTLEERRTARQRFREERREGRRGG